ncbi:MAG: tetratricopeptide repeat protein [Deltaproteobacteria bacterium]|nr:tetratricopeptide repeat protein [Deltaproteobacteria bacterium]
MTKNKKDKTLEESSVELAPEDMEVMDRVRAMSPGVYRHTSWTTIGTGSTAKRKIQIIDYYFKELEPDEFGLFSAQVVDYTGKPLQMFDRLRPSEVYKMRLISENLEELPKILDRVNMLRSHVKIAERHLEQGEYHSAEYEYDNALKIDKHSVEANLGKGKTLFKMERYEEAKEIFDELSENPELYLEEHKHLFNEYGINLRQMSMYDCAAESYKRAIRVNPYDPHLYYNLAITCVKLGDAPLAVKLLDRAVKLKRKLENVSFPEAESLLKRIKSKLPEN